MRFIILRSYFKTFLTFQSLNSRISVSIRRNILVFVSYIYHINFKTFKQEFLISFVFKYPDFCFYAQKYYEICCIFSLDKYNFNLIDFG